MSRGPYRRDAYGLTRVQREAFSAWLGTGREPLDYAISTVSVAKRALGLRRATAVECLAWAMVHEPDWIPADSTIGKALARVLRRAELGHAIYLYARELGMEGKGE